jgi:diacylglycerol kinase (ATP)
VVYNPIKVDLAKLKKVVAAAEKEAGWETSTWFSTTKKDAGQAATARALKDGADVVLAAGGDGTVRAVAEALRDSGVPIAPLPSGTGNLLVRNLGLSLGNLDESVSAAFTGADRAIDMGLVEITRGSGETEEYVFLVVAGLGIDAKMIAKTNSKLKKAVGWLAYVDAGMRALPEAKPIRLHYRLDHGHEKLMDVHSLMIGNCGTLPGGILLMPDAKPDDGILDIAALRPHGPFGWIKVWNKITWENGVLRKSAAGRMIIDLTADVKDVTYFRGKDLVVTVETPQAFQLDGDEFGEALSVHTWVDAGALTVKVPG